VETVLINPLIPASPGLVSESTRPGSSPAGSGSFGAMMERLLGSAAQQQAQADQAVRDLALGRTEDVHNVLLAAAKADLSFRLVLEIRNRLLEAYQQVMSMQV
jgi:flagellar hook-basal body complex protein FliE